jgi:hypothetical protein
MMSRRACDIARDFEHKSCKIALKIAFPKKILLTVQPGAARIAPSSIEKICVFIPL